MKNTEITALIRIVNRTLIVNVLFEWAPLPNAPFAWLTLDARQRTEGLNTLVGLCATKVPSLRQQFLRFDLERDKLDR
jgi:hypothetical protein